MEKSGIAYDRKDMERVEAELLNIQNSCNRLQAFSREKGGIPFVERNLERIRAPLNILMSVSEVLKIVKEE